MYCSVQLLVLAVVLNVPGKSYLSDYEVSIAVLATRTANAYVLLDAALLHFTHSHGAQLMTVTQQQCWSLQYSLLPSEMKVLTYGTFILLHLRLNLDILCTRTDRRTNR